MFLGVAYSKRATPLDRVGLFAQLFYISQTVCASGVADPDPFGYIQNDSALEDPQSDLVLDNFK